MKILNTILITLFTSTIGFSQNDSVTNNQTLFYSLIGTWEHVSSTYPSGDVVTYQRKFDFFADGTGICTRYTDLDTVLINFEWTVQDNIVSLYSIQKNGKRIYADSQSITFADVNRMYLRSAYCEEQNGKVCCYYRSENQMAKY